MSYSIASRAVNSVSINPSSQSSKWLIHPSADILFIINILWPLLFWAGFSLNLFGHSSLQFWQIYFVTTPHRWITLWLVYADTNRFRERPNLFIGLATFVILSCLLIFLSTGALTCLLAIDYIWNAWHFAAQHYGIYRLYDRKASPSVSSGLVLKWVFRLSLIYVIFRIAGWSWQFKEFENGLMKTDYFLFGFLSCLLLWEWIIHLPRSVPRSSYLTSVVLLFLSLLWAVHEHRPDMVLVLSTASALFHATEYLAVVSWNVHDRARKQVIGGLMLKLAPVWVLFLVTFSLALGVSGWWIERYGVKVWITANIMAAFLHYSYDGLIWRKTPAK